MSSFIDLALSGNALVEEINDYVDRWHDSTTPVPPLDVYLGMTPEEYVLWVESTANLPYIIAARRAGTSVAEFNSHHTEFKLAARAEKSDRVRNIATWLARRNAGTT
jgi:hypothetical protein